MKKILPFLICLLFFSLNGYNQININWVHQIGNGNNMVKPKAMQVNDNYLFVSGLFNGTVDFNPDPDHYYPLTSTPSNYYNHDFFISKYSLDGKLIWARGFGNDDHKKDIYSIQKDSIGNIYITGFYKRTIDFDPGPGFHYLTALNNYRYTIFVLKLDPEGEFLWVRNIFSMTELDEWYPLPPYGHTAIGKNGNIYSTGTLTIPTDVDPGPDSIILSPIILGPNSLNTGIFMSKVNSEGDLVWVKSFDYDSFSIQQVNNIVIDVDENIIITGTTTDSFDIDPGLNKYLIEKGAFLAKYDSGGNFLWYK